MASTNTFAPILFHLGPLPIGETVVTTWALLLMIFVISWLSTRRLRLEPGPWQVALEGIVGAIQDAIEAVAAGIFREHPALRGFPLDLSGPC